MRVLVYAVPLAGSIVFVRAATALTGVPTSSLWAFLAWWFALSLAATVVVSLAYSASRRLLPLGALLELSLVFPDEAPSRFRLALRSGTVAELEERLRRMRQRDEKVDVQEAAEILLQLVSALDVHDRITRGHAERVRAYAYSLGKQLDLTDRELDLLNWAALLHDIGKLSVSTAILNKPGRPTELEWAQLRLHPLHGEMLVEPIRGWLGEWTGAVGYHHERWDGTGYPRGIAGEEIPLGGRIVAIADVFDVITSTRSYKKSSTAAEARAEIARCSGEQFDPRLVRAFVEMSLGRMRMVVGPLSWLAHAPLLSRLPAIPSLGAALGGVTTWRQPRQVGWRARSRRRRRLHSVHRPRRPRPSRRRCCRFAPTLGESRRSRERTTSRLLLRRSRRSTPRFRVVRRSRRPCPQRPRRPTQLRPPRRLEPCRLTPLRLRARHPRLRPRFPLRSHHPSRRRLRRSRRPRRRLLRRLRRRLLHPCR